MKFKQLNFTDQIRLFNSDLGPSLDFKEGVSESFPCREVTFQITSSCNLRCDYCYECNKSDEVMSIETGKKICDLLTKEIDKDEGMLGRKTLRGLSLEFIGGEPLLYVDLIDQIMQYFFNKLIDVRPELVPYVRLNITTNGVNFLEPKVQNFIKRYYNIMSITVSLDGIKELHDAHRTDKNGKGSFSQAYAAFQKAKDYGWYHSKMTFSQESLPYIYRSIVFMVNEGLREINCNCTYEPEYTPNDARILYSEIKKIADFLFKNGISDRYITFVDKNLGAKNKDNHNYCGGTGNMLSFAPDGKAYPCLRYQPISLGERARNWVIGDYLGIYNTPDTLKIKDYLDSVTYESQSTEECINCSISAGCGWCSAYNYQSMGDVNKRNTNYCWAHRGQVLAHLYYINKRSIFWKDVKPKDFTVPDDIALQIINQEELEMLKSLSIEAKSQYTSSPESYDLNYWW